MGLSTTHQQLTVVGDIACMLIVELCMLASHSVSSTGRIQLICQTNEGPNRANSPGTIMEMTV